MDVADHQPGAGSAADPTSKVESAAPDPESGGPLDALTGLLEGVIESAEQAIREQAAAAVQSHLQPGEELLVVVPGSNLPAWLDALDPVSFVFGRPRYVARTQWRTLVVQGGWRGGARSRLLAQGPPNVPVGPPSGRWRHVWRALGPKVRIRRRYDSLIRRADRVGGVVRAEAGAPTGDERDGAGPVVDRRRGVTQVPGATTAGRPPSDGGGRG